MSYRLALAILSFTTLFAANSPVSAQEKLRLAWAGFSPTNSPIWVIEDRKLMQKQGVQPEIIAMPIVEISPGYLKWLTEQVQGG